MNRYALAIVLLIACQVRAAAGIELQLKANAEQTTMTLLVGDVIELDAAGDRALLATRLPNKGKVGDTVVFTRAELTRAISGAKSVSRSLRWTGAQRVLVRRRGVMLEPAQYIEWARERLHTHLRAGAERVELKLIGSYRALAIPVGQHSVTARFAPEDSARSDRIWLDLAVDGQYYTTVALAFEVRRFAPALVLREAGAKYQALAPERAMLATVDIGVANGTPLDDPRQLLGKRLRHDLAPGYPIATGDIENRPSIEVGAEVQVYASVGRVVVQTRGIAQRDGHVGQRIRVLTPNNNEQLAVEVIGDNRAMVSNRPQP